MCALARNVRASKRSPRVCIGRVKLSKQKRYKIRIVDVVFNEKRHAENFNNGFVGFKVHGTQKVRQRHLPRPVYTHGYGSGSICFKFYPRPAIWYHGRIVNELAILIQSLFVVGSRRAHQLRHYHAFRPIYYEGSGVRHHRKISQEHFLLFDLSPLFIQKLDFNADRRGVGTVAAFAFIEGVFRVAEGEIFEEQFEVAGEIGYRGNIFENFF